MASPGAVRPSRTHRDSCMDPVQFHSALMRFARDRLEPRLPDQARDFDDESPLRALESRFVEEERAAVQPLAREAPRDVDAFVRWFEGLRETGPGQGDPLFPWLAHEATLQQMKWFLAQEV